MDSQPTQPPQTPPTGARTVNVIATLQQATRPAVTVLFAVTVCILALLKVVDANQFVQLVSTVMAFWFGAKGLASSEESPKPPVSNP